MPSSTDPSRGDPAGAVQRSPWRSAVISVVGCLAVATGVTYLSGPWGSSSNVLAYLSVDVLASVAAVWGAWRWRQHLGVVGVLVAGAVVCGLVGDLGYNVNAWDGADYFPAWTDVVYLLAYVALTAAAMLMVRRREGSRDAAALIDAAIVAVGFAVVVYAFVIVGAATDPDVSVIGRVVGVAYPACDVLVAGVIARLLIRSGTTSVPAVLLVTAMGVVLLGDAAYAVAVFDGTTDSYPQWVDVCYLTYYLLLGLTMVRKDAGSLTERVPDETQRLSKPRLAALVAGTLLAPLTLLVGGVAGDVLKVRGAAIGAAVLFLLAMARMAQLVRAVESQSELLKVLARTDGLTGLANRRTFDYEIQRAVELARNDPRSAVVSVVMIDLDRFKVFNDTYGHAAGDQLLRQAAQAWSDQLKLLAPVAMLARYGGEEFAVVLPGVEEDAAAQITRALLAVMPLGQSFSAGVAQHAEGEDAAALVGRADRRLYDAKEAGRGRVVGGPPLGTAAPPRPEPAVAMSAG